MSNVTKLVAKYNDNANPETWLLDYVSTVNLSDGKANCVVRFLTPMLDGTARMCIESLPEKTVNSWEDMKQVFIQHFQGTYKRPKSITNLQQCVQGNNESSREFVSQWSEVKNACEGVFETQAIHTFKQSQKNSTHFRFMVFSDQSTTLGGLLACANKFAVANDNNREDLDSRRKNQPSKKSTDNQAGPSTEVAAAFGKGSQSSDSWRNKKLAEDRQSRSS